MTKRVVLITGSTDGLGEALALRCAREGETVLLHGRSAVRIAAARERLLREAPGATVRGYQADFLSLRETAHLIERLRSQEPCIDVLVNNAGVGVEDERRTSCDGYEQVLQVNYLATYAITLGLVDTLKASRGRAICVSSETQATLDFDDPQFTIGWNGLNAYARSKWAQVAFSAGMAERLNGTGVTIHALHPGTLMPTKIVLKQFSVLDPIESGVASLWALAHHPTPEQINGGYFKGTTPARALASAYDRNMQNRLLELSSRLLTAACDRCTDWKARSRFASPASERTDCGEPPRPPTRKFEQ